MSLSPTFESVIDHNLDESMVKHPGPKQGILRMFTSVRGPLLPAWGSRDRERQLRIYWHHDYNTLFRGAVAALIKRVQSTPYEVKAPKRYGDYWQRMLMAADFGDWDRFVSKVLIDYSRHDQGSMVELIAPGNPNEAPTGPVTGLAVLDSVRCWPTGNPTWPMLYYDLNGKLHQIHRARILQFIDTPDSSEDTPGYGDCALSRAIAPVNRQILMGRYIEQSLDDKAPPGVMVFGNIAEEQVAIAIEQMNTAKNTDVPGEWGRVIRLHSLHAEEKPTVDVITYTKPPESFNFEQYTNLDAREIALSLGIDVQDIWGELSGSGLGTGRQSEILAQKSRGKGLGRILKSLERMINRALPEDVEFTWKYEDPQEDLEQASILQTTASSVQILSTVLDPQEARTLLANTVPAIHDVLVDETGNVRRLGDSDPESTQPEISEDVLASTPPPMPQVAPFSQFQKGAKDFSSTSADFIQSFSGSAIGAQGMSPAVLRALLRDKLWTAGYAAYEDGLREGGMDPADADAEELARRRNVVAEWNAAQTTYIDNFANEVAREGLTPDQIAQRAVLWVSKSLRAIYYVGLIDTKTDLVYPWLLGPAEKHCPTCLANAGQQHTMKEWAAAGMLPGSSSLACGGWECQCKFGQGMRGRSVGRLPGARPSFGDRLMGWVRGLVGR